MKIIKWSLKTLASLSLFCLIFGQSFANSNTKADILKRLEPVGKVFIAKEQPQIKQQESNKIPVKSVASEKPSKVSGKAIYADNCQLCHTTGVANSPILGNKQQWAPRITQGMDKLIEHAIKGYNAMPPKGGCIKCTDEDIAAAVKYMVNKSK